MRKLAIPLLCALASTWLIAGHGGAEWVQVWRGRGCPQGQIINGFLLEGTYLPLQFQFRIEPRTSTVVWKNKQAKMLDSHLIDWLIFKMKAENAFENIDKLTILKVNFSGSSCEILLSKFSSAT